MEQTVEPFLAKMNKDLVGWTNRQSQIKQLIADYKSTLVFVNQSKKGDKIMVDIGQQVFSKGKRVTNTIVLRVKQGIFVEVQPNEASKMIPQFISLYQQKLKSARGEISKIRYSMKQVEDLLTKYSMLT